MNKSERDSIDQTKIDQKENELINRYRPSICCGTAMVEYPNIISAGEQQTFADSVPIFN